MTVRKWTVYQSRLAIGPLASDYQRLPAFKISSSSHCGVAKVKRRVGKD